MNIGNKISDLRKEKGLSRDVLGKKVGTSGAVIGRYEREEITPSIEVAAKIADALEISLDYLTGGTSTIVKDKKMLYRLELLQKVSKKERDTILHVMDALLQTAQLTNTQQKLM
jgi:transcriptional regulator with XRE-family HTH domain